ncbi:DUF29 domain-containing protein [Pseudanabaena biceps]|nr:DUF29 domain-containing protein [Pseudanabaena biceps]
MIASQEIGLDIIVFPEICPFTKDNVLDPQYLPQEDC